MDSISVVSNPTKTNYNIGNYLNPTGLVIKLYYSDETNEDIIYNDETKKDFTFNPSLITSLKVNMKTVTVTYGGKQTTFTISVTQSGGGNIPSSGGGSSGGGGGGGRINNELNSVPNITEIQNIKIESPSIDSSVVVWEFIPLTNKYTMKIKMDNQLVPAQNVFVTIDELNIKKGEGMQLAKESKNTYYFDGEGNMVTGWVKTLDGKWYFFENEKNINEGSMVKGWKQVSGAWYYFYDDGSMLINGMTPDGYLVDVDGKFIP